MRSIGCFFMFVLLFASGCVIERSPLYELPDAGNAADASQVRPTLNIDDIARNALPEGFDNALDLSPPDPAPVATWPRSHPVGTLLVDHLGDLWMVVEDGLRAPVSGDDTLGLISLDEHDATLMTLEEERCLRPTEDYWGPLNYNWWPVYGPTEEDPGPFILDGSTITRRPVSYETLESWGYYWRWMDYFDGGEDEWLSYAFDPTPIPIRDGTIVHTEHGFYYVVHGRSFWFSPRDLVDEAGYHPENALWMRDTRLRELAPASTSFNHETFDRCPADEGSAP
jgi:hypothetical protein